MRFYFKKRTAEAINFLNEITEKGLDLQEFAKSLINYLRQVLILKMTGSLISGLTKEEFQKLEKQSTSFKEDELRSILNLFLEAETKIKYSSIPQLPLELAIVEICGVAQFEPR